MTDPVNEAQEQPEAAKEKPNLSGVTTEQLRAELAARDQADIEVVQLAMKASGVGVRCLPRLVPTNAEMTRWAIDTDAYTFVKERRRDGGAGG